MSAKTVEPAFWCEGFYRPVMEDFAEWRNDWSMGPHALEDWVWVKGDYYTEAQVRALLDNPAVDRE